MGAGSTGVALRSMPVSVLAVWSTLRTPEEEGTFCTEVSFADSGLEFGGRGVTLCELGRIEGLSGVSDMGNPVKLGTFQ